MGDIANYGLIDAVLVDEVDELREMINCLSLYKGETAERLADYAPYVLPISNHAMRARLAEHHGDRMIFIRCPLDIAELQRHFRKFLIVRGHDGRNFYFRFYDPFVLRVFLPTCTANQLESFFGPIETLWIAEEDASSPERYLRYCRAEGGLAIAPEDWTGRPAPATAGGGS